MLGKTFLDDFVVPNTTEWHMIAFYNTFPLAAHWDPYWVFDPSPCKQMSWLLKRMLKLSCRLIYTILWPALLQDGD
jgi:hypothetical protein